MAFTHKLSRRLAVLRALTPHWAVLSTLALIVACSAGVPTGVDTGLNPADAPIVVNPRSLILEANQVSVFKAYATGVPGDSLVTSIEWTATGGSISLSGTYSSPSLGDFKVVGKRHGPTRTTSDTATVTVVQQQPSITQVVISPTSATVQAQTQQPFSATGRLSDGSTVAIGVTWSATGGSIDAGGLYTAGTTPGTYRVIAQAASANVADTVPVTVVGAPVVSSGSGNEPSGFSRIAEWGFDELTPNQTRLCSGYGILAGCWWRFSDNVTVVTDATGPKSPGTVLQYTWPAGLPIGTSAGFFGGWNSTSGTEFSRIYESGWFKIPTPDFELPQSVGGMKLLGFWGVGKLNVPGDAANSVIGWVNGSGIVSSMSLAIIQQNQVARAMQQNVSTTPAIRCGQWIHYEILMGINDIGAANGTLDVWINGVKTHQYRDVVWRTSTAPSGFYWRKWDPTWGGNGNVPPKSRSDRMYVDHIYISGAK